MMVTVHARVFKNVQLSFNSQFATKVKRKNSVSVQSSADVAEFNVGAKHTHTYTQPDNPTHS